MQSLQPSTIAATLFQGNLGPGLALGDAGHPNAITIEGLALGARDGALTFEIATLAVKSLRLASGGLTLDIGQLTLRQLKGRLAQQLGSPALETLAVASVDAAGVQLQGPLAWPAALQRAWQAAHPERHTQVSVPTSGTWKLDPVAAAEGTIRAEIVDAHLVFDAEVTVPIRQGGIDFNAATVEHVGPDSRMGISRLGVYVDAPNGRSYLFQFAHPPVAGVTYEKRGPLLGVRVADRGHLQLQPFIEALLGQWRPGTPLGTPTSQTRLLLDRTAIAGEVRLGDGEMAMPGLQLQLAGRAEGRNAVHLEAEAVGRGLSADVPAMLARALTLDTGSRPFTCDELSGALKLQLMLDAGELRFALSLPQMRATGLRLAGPA